METHWTDKRQADAPTQANEPRTPLALARRLWETHRPQEEGEEQRMVYDYVPDWLAPHIPALYSQDRVRDPVVWLKLFLPEGRWTFYVTEYSAVAPDGAPDGVPDLFFGYLASSLGEAYDELGYVTLEQIEEIHGPHLGSRIERDLWWTPKPLSEVKAALKPPPTSGNRKARATQTPEVQDAETIEAREGDPCTVVVGDDGEIIGVVNPAWLYRQWRTLLGERDEIDDAEAKADAIARSMFLEGTQAHSASASEFRRFCRCVIQRCVVQNELLVNATGREWERDYRDGSDFASPSYWEAFVGTQATEPQFDVGDEVRIAWRSKDEAHTVYTREWREYHSRWYYKVDGKWHAEDDLVVADEDDEEDANETETSTLPPGWTIEDVQALLDALAEGPVLVADGDLGLPTIHDFRADAQHLGLGMFEVQTEDYTLQYDAGRAMKRTPSSHGWTRLRVVEGAYDYPLEDVQIRLERYLDVAPDGDAEGTEEEPAVPAAIAEGDQVWWMEGDEVHTGVVDFVRTQEGEAIVRYDQCLAVAGGVPVGRLEHVPLDRLHKGTPPVAETADDADNAADESTDDAPTVETNEAETKDESDAEAQLRRQRNLPDDVPLAIEVDLGHTHGWAEAEVTKVCGRWLYYALREAYADKADRHGGRVQVIGRDIIWRQSAEAAP